MATSTAASGLLHYIMGQNLIPNLLQRAINGNTSFLPARLRLVNRVHREKYMRLS